MDIFTRGIRGWELSMGLDEGSTISALERALGGERASEIDHSDNGVQYLSSGYLSLLKERRIAISLAGKGKGWGNSYAERLIRTLKDYDDAYAHMSHFLNRESGFHWFLEKAIGCRDRYIPPGCSNANADVESFHGLIEREFFEQEEFYSREEGILLPA